MSLLTEICQDHWASVRRNLHHKSEWKEKEGVSKSTQELFQVGKTKLTAWIEPAFPPATSKNNLAFPSIYIPFHNTRFMTIPVINRMPATPLTIKFISTKQNERVMKRESRFEIAFLWFQFRAHRLWKVSGWRRSIVCKNCVDVVGSTKSICHFWRTLTEILHWNHLGFLLATYIQNKLGGRRKDLDEGRHHREERTPCLKCIFNSSQAES